MDDLHGWKTKTKVMLRERGQTPEVTSCLKRFMKNPRKDKAVVRKSRQQEELEPRGTGGW